MRVLSFGEVLWDVFEDKYVIGGAAFNFSAHAVRLGARADLISGVGRDALGCEALKYLAEYGVGSGFVSRLDCPTGTARVEVDEGGTPCFSIPTGSAFDNISLSQEELNSIRAAEYDIFYCGSLAAREQVSRGTLFRLLELDFPCIVYDMNIRGDFFDLDAVRLCLERCNILKMSRDEIDMAKRFLKGSPDTVEDVGRMLWEQFGTENILLTLDKDGAAVFDHGKMYQAPNHQCTVVSTVGCGDSFTAAFAVNHMAGADLSQCIDRSLSLAAYVAGRLGAIPDYDDNIKAALAL